MSNRSLYWLLEALTPHWMFIAADRGGACPSQAFEDAGDRKAAHHDWLGPILNQDRTHQPGTGDRVATRDVVEGAHDPIHQCVRPRAPSVSALTRRSTFPVSRGRRRSALRQVGAI